MTSGSSWFPSDISRPVHIGRNSIFRLEYFLSHREHPRILAMKSVARPQGDAEASAMKDICFLHEAFVRLYHHEVTPTHVRLFMEFADFGNADRLIDSMQLYDCPYSQPQILEIAYNLLGALSVMHEQGWAHRDIKPANLFVFLQGTVKIGDLGVAKRVFDPKGDNTLQGTEAFMSPNLSAGLDSNCQVVKTNPFKDDVYALGSSLFSIASWARLSEMGTPTKESQSMFEAFIRASMHRYSEDVQTLLCSMVYYDEAKRPSATEAYEAVLRMLSIVPRLRGCSACGIDQILTILECGHRLCQQCFSQLVSSQLESAEVLSDFKCAKCAGKIGAPVLLANKESMSAEARKRLRSMEGKKRLRLFVV